MDKRTRGFIEKELDYTVSKTNITDGMRWILDELPIIHSSEEFALAYVLGSLTRYAHNVVRGRKRSRRIIRLMKKKRYAEIETLRVDVTEEEATEIRDMLRRRLQDIMEKINRELGR